MDQNFGSGPSMPGDKKETATAKLVSALKREFVIVGRTRIKSWQAWLLIGVMTGIVITVSWLANRSVELQPSHAEESVSETQGSSDGTATAEVVALTNDLLQAADNASTEVAPEDAAEATPPSSEEINAVKEKAEARREKIEGLLENDRPDIVLKVALPEDLRQDLPSYIQPSVEKATTEEGELEITHADFKDGSSKFIHTLKTGNGRRIALKFARDPIEKSNKRLKTGDRIRVKGVELGDAMAVGSTAEGVQPLSTAGLSLSNTFGPQKTAVILVNFQDAPTQPYTVAYARSVVFTTTNDFWKENSYGQTSITGDVFGWYTIPMSSATCGPYSMAGYARAAAQAAGVNLSGYTHLITAFPDTTACGWWGLGTIGGNPSQAWINGEFDLRVVGHEMGHNLGLYHSHALDCGATVLGQNCTAIEYGDTADTMGSGRARINGINVDTRDSAHYNAFQKELLGWLNYGASPSITTVQSSGTYTIAPYESATSTLPRALKISRSPYANSFYVEYRRPIGFDSFFSAYSNIINGILVHYADPLNPTGSYLLDMTPQTSSWWDPALLVGQSFSEPVSGVTLNTVSAGAAGASVSVTYGGGGNPCVRANPTVTVSPVNSYIPACTSVTYNVTVYNNDVVACSNGTFTLNTVAPSGWSVSPGSLGSIAPGAQGSVNVTVTSPSNVSIGTYPIRFDITNAADTSFKGSAASVYNVTSVSCPPPPHSGTFIDDFTRVQAGSVLGNGWVETRGNFLIENNELKNDAKTGVYVAVQPTLTGSGESVTADFARVGFPSSKLGVVLRYQDPKNYYMLYRRTGGVRKVYISKVVDGAEKVLAKKQTPNLEQNVFSRIEGKAASSTLTLLINGTEIISANDTTFTNGAVGIVVVPNSRRSQRIDNFSATISP